MREQVESTACPTGDDPDAGDDDSAAVAAGGGRRVGPSCGWWTPDRPADSRATGDLAAGRTLAYASPFSLEGRSLDGRSLDGALPDGTSGGTSG